MVVIMLEYLISILGLTLMQALEFLAFPSVPGVPSPIDILRIIMG